jgi:hypothetical protein
MDNCISIDIVIYIDISIYQYIYIETLAIKV